MTKAFTAALLSAITLAASDLPTVNESDFTEHWFDNKIDHFNYQQTSTYK
jgi:hypothetical protein